jgi:signal transduction histidine kinase
MQRISLPKLFEECFRDATLRSPIDFEVSVTDPAESYEMLGERLQMSRALQNLITNAVTAVENELHPSIKVECAIDNADIEVRIRDNGCGVDTKTLRWIFESFDHTDTVEKGAGLGLFITKKVIEEHRGTLQIESRIGEGTIVTLRVPQAHTALGYYARPDGIIES